MPINPIPIADKKDINTRKKEEKKVEFYLCDSKYSFDDIILPDDIKCKVRDIIALDNYKDLIFEKWGLNKVLKKAKNISVNFYGESGTGKTMTAHAMAKELGKKLLIVDYSEIESKYVGETSKNLVNLFSFADSNNAIILFDEADALLSKRVTSMSSATDVSVNQTRNVLLKLLDDYEGMVIFTTNFIQNFDSAFFRRIISHIEFKLPDQSIREKLWKHYIVPELPVRGSVADIISKLSEIDYVSGSDISNVVLKTAIHIASQKKNFAEYTDFKVQLDEIISGKKAISNDNFEIKTKKVSKEYVEEKLGKDMISNGYIRENS